MKGDLLQFLQKLKESGIASYWLHDLSLNPQDLDAQEIEGSERIFQELGILELRYYLKDSFERFKPGKYDFLIKGEKNNSTYTLKLFKVL